MNEWLDRVSSDGRLTDEEEVGDKENCPKINGTFKLNFTMITLLFFLKDRILCDSY